MTPCPMCGERRRLGPDGLCRWRHGCEHRAMVQDARRSDLERELARVLNPEPEREPTWQEQAWRFYGDSGGS